MSVRGQLSENTHSRPGVATGIKKKCVRRFENNRRRRLFHRETTLIAISLLQTSNLLIIAVGFVLGTWPLKSMVFPVVLTAIDVATGSRDNLSPTAPAWPVGIRGFTGRLAGTFLRRNARRNFRRSRLHVIVANTNKIDKIASLTQHVGYLNRLGPMFGDEIRLFLPFFTVVVSVHPRRAVRKGCRLVFGFFQKSLMAERRGFRSSCLSYTMCFQILVYVMPQPGQMFLITR